MIINNIGINFAGGGGGTPAPSKVISTKDFGITANGTTNITMDQGVDGISAGTISVDVQPVLTSATFTNNGTYNPGTGVDGYSAVTVNVDGAENRLNKFLKGEITAITESSGDLDGVGTGLTGYRFAYSNLVLYDAPNTELNGSNMFQDCYNLKTANTNYYRVAFTNDFTNCTALTDVSITIPFYGQQPYFGRQAFKDCKSLTALTFTEAPIRSYFISDEVFSGCSGLTGNYDVYTPDNTFEVDGLFADCKSLTSVTFKNNINSLGKSSARNLFSGCTSMEYLDLTHCYKVPTLPNNLKFTAFTSNYEIRVPQMLYDDWTAVTNWSTTAAGHIVAYPNLAGPLTIRYTTTDGNDLTPTVAWSNTGWTTCGSFVSQEFDATTGGTVVYSGFGVVPLNGLKYNSASNLASIEFDGYLGYVGVSAFTHNDNLTSLVLPDTCQFIGSYGLNSMSGLESVVFGTGLSKIEGYCQYLPSLTSITFKSTMPPAIGNYGVFSTGIPTSGTVYVPASAVERYKAWIKYWAESGTSSTTNFRPLKDWTVTAIQE